MASEELLKGIRARWDDLTSFVAEPVKEKWWSTIVNNYSTRPFHNLQHLNEMLLLFDKYKDKLRDRYAVAFAIFFKHLVYDPQSSDDAERNAAKLREFSQETTFDQENYVADLLVESGKNCTEAHLTPNEYGSDDLHYLVDFDMAWLGAEPERYDELSAKIREEDKTLNDNDYRQQRLKILRLFLQVPNIYATREFRDQFEAVARRNIQREIDTLTTS
ncbi:hypothetical protein AAVH_05319 [Aphelenchoides avenae]|nr:hypothetical protein AAVH_05319 [Aphelenchus avenae]